MDLTKAQDNCIQRMWEGEILFWNDERNRYEIGTGRGFDTAEVRRATFLKIRPFLFAYNPQGSSYGLNAKGEEYARSRFGEKPC